MILTKKEASTESMKHTKFIYGGKNTPKVMVGKRGKPLFLVLFLETDLKTLHLIFNEKSNNDPKHK